MWRLLHVVATGALVGSAVYAYSIKYETIWYAEQIATMKRNIAEEHDRIAMLRADWAHLIRPERIQALAASNLEAQPLTLNQIVRLADLPDPAPQVDSIGRTLDLLGLKAATNTPRNAKASPGATPSSSR